VLGRSWLESLYASYNRPACAAGDPVRFLHAHADVREREVVGLIAAFLVHGRLETVLRSVENALARLEGAPRTGGGPFSPEMGLTRRQRPRPVCRIKAKAFRNPMSASL
jgi:hypothetical protein